MKVFRTILGVSLGTLLAGGMHPCFAEAQEAKVPDEIRTFALANAVDRDDFNDIQTALRNVLPHARLYALPVERKIVVSGSPGDLAAAQKMLTELDETKKPYRLTYTITDMDGGKRIGTQHSAIILVAGGKTQLKQGSKVPVVTGSYDTGNTAGASNTQVQYLDLGLEIEARLDGDRDGIKLYSKIVQSSVAEEKSIAGAQDPVIRQTVLEGSSALVPGKPLILGSIDIPGSTRHQDVEVVAELVK